MKLSELTKEAPAKRTCVFGNWVDSLDEEDKKSVERVFQDPNWSTIAITRAFREAGCSSARDLIALHRAGECKVCNKA
jgi:hypothetical protein